VQERALVYSASTGAPSRASTRPIVGRVRGRDRGGGSHWQTRRRRSVAAAKTRKRARRRRPSAQARRRLSRPKLSATSRPRIHAKPSAAPVWTGRWGATPPATADRRPDALRLGFYDLTGLGDGRVRPALHAPEVVWDRTYSARTSNSVSVTGPNVVSSATSTASRPRPTTTRPTRRRLLRASNVCHASSR
jgi:hypothetical protein